MFGQISQWNKVFHEGVEKMNGEPQEVYMRHESGGISRTCINSFTTW